MKRLIYILVLVLVGLTVWSVFFTVHETQYAVVTRFGDPIREIMKPGLHAKLPWPVDLVNEFDRRLMVCDVPGEGESPKEFLTEDKKNIEVSGYACWKIVQPRQFLETVGSRENAEDVLAYIVVSRLGVVLGQNPLVALLSTNPDELKLAAIMEEVLNDVDQDSAGYGIKIVDFRINRVNFPEQNRRSVFDRMRAERNRIATKFRSEGAADAARIRAEADMERTKILAEAYRESQEIKGRAEAEATRIYAEAYGKDAEFYEFLRILASYEKTLTAGETTLFLPADSPYLKLLRTEGAIPMPSLPTDAPNAATLDDVASEEGSHDGDR